jgi:hypothetical protein
MTRPTIESSVFRKTYPKLTEPTDVVRYSKVIGTWVPIGTLPQDEVAEAPVEQAPEQLHAAPQTTAGPYTEWHPAPKPTSAKKAAPYKRR